MEMRPAACETCLWWQASDGPLGGGMIKHISKIGSDALRVASSSYGRIEATMKGADKACSTCA